MGANSGWRSSRAARPPVQRQDRLDERPAGAVAAENYDAKGVRVGSFRLFPELELDEVYNDNIYAASTSTQGSLIQMIKPTLDLRSDWTRHMFNAFAKGSFGLYSVDNTNNYYYDYGVGFDGRVDIQRDWNFYGGSSFNARHEDRGTPQSVNPTLEPNKYNQLAGNVGYFQKFNRLSVRLDARLDDYHYTNIGLGPAFGSIFNFDRDRTEFREAVRVGYEFSPGFEIWTRGSLNQRRYVDAVDTLGFTHNSSGFDAVGGVSIDLGGITSVEVFAAIFSRSMLIAATPRSAGLFSALQVTGIRSRALGEAISAPHHRGFRSDDKFRVHRYHWWSGRRSSRASEHSYRRPWRLYDCRLQRDTG